MANCEIGISTLRNRFPACRYVGTYDRTYFVWLSPDAGGSIYINYFDHDSHTYGTPVKIDDGYGVDAHKTPTVYVIQSGTYAGYILICQPYAGTYRSTAAETMSFDALVSVNSGGCSYCQLIELGDGTLAVFYQSGSLVTQLMIKYSTSDDGGQTWSAATTVVAFGDPYWNYPVVTAKGNSVHLAWHTFQYGTSSYKNVYYVYSPDNLATWRTQGSAAELELPIDAAHAEVVYTHETTWVQDIQVDGAGSPVITWVDSVDSYTGLAYWAHYHAGAWSAHSTGVNTMKYIKDALLAYNSGIFIDPADTTHVFIGALGTNFNSNIQEWHTTDSGPTWAKVSDITTFGAMIASEPRPVINYSSDLKLFYNIILNWTSNTDFESVFNMGFRATYIEKACTNSMIVYNSGSAWVLGGVGANPVWSGYNTSSFKKAGGGWYFPSIPVGKSITMTYARMVFKAWQSNADTAVKTRVIGDKPASGSSVTFTTLALYQARRGTSVGGANNNYRTTAAVDYDSLIAWVDNHRYITPSLITVVQEIIDAAVWAKNNNMALFWDDHDVRGDQANSRIRWADYPAYLLLVYPTRLGKKNGLTLSQMAKVNGLAIASAVAINGVSI